jgi:hypothetical protein
MSDVFWNELLIKLDQKPSGRIELDGNICSYMTYIGFCGIVEKEKYVEIYISPMWNRKNIDFCKSMVKKGNDIFKARGILGRVLLYKKHMLMHSNIRVIGQDVATSRGENYSINLAKVGYKLIRRQRATSHIILYCDRTEVLKLANYAVDEEKNTTLLGKVIKTAGGNQYSISSVILGHCVGEMLLMNGIGNCAIDISFDDEVLSLDGLHDELICEMILGGMKVCEHCEINSEQYLGEWIEGSCADCYV